MTRINKGEINLKSTVYNQSGQNYFEQLMAYNSMSAHLRHILLAKCVVDARNKNYIRKKKQSDCKPRSARTDIESSIINRLPYDPSCHTADFSRMYRDAKSLCQRGAPKESDNAYNCDLVRLGSKLHTRLIYPSFRTPKTYDQEQCLLNNKIVERRTSVSSKRVLRSSTKTKSALKMLDGCDENSVSYESAFEHETTDESSIISTLRGNDNYEETQERVINIRIEDKKIGGSTEEAKYAKFIYEITREIIVNGLYTDAELHEVFKKHVEGNKNTLDMNRMEYEIFQLKLALNVPTNSDLEKSNRSVNISVRPLESAGNLNGGGMTDNLTRYRRLKNDEAELLIGNSKSLELAETNSKLLVTKDDILSSLMEADINPERASEIFQRLATRNEATTD